MPVRAGRVPGGVPKFLAQTQLQPIVFTTPASLGTAEGENVVRQERVVYDQTSAPVFFPSVVAAAQTLVEVTASALRCSVVRSLAVFAATSAMAEPVYVPPAAATSISSTLASTHSTAVVVRSQVVYDTTSTPVFKPPAATPSAFAYQPVDALWIRQRKDLPDGYVESIRPPAATTPSVFAYQPVDALWRIQKKDLPDGFAEPLRPAAVAAVVVGPVPDAPQNWTLPRQTKPIPRSSYVFAYPVDDLADDYTGQFIRPKRKLLPDGYIQPPFQPPPPVVGPSIDSKMVGAYGSPVVILSRVVYDPIAARPAFPPAPPPTTPTPNTAPPPNSLTVVRTVTVVLNQPTTPVFPPTPPVIVGATTPSTVPPDAPLNSFRPPRIKPVQQSAFVFAYPIDDYAEDYPAQFRRWKKVLPDGLALPPFQPPAPAVTPSYLFETIAPPWKAKPNRLAIDLDLKGIERPSADVAPPPPVAATPANLFDNLGAVTRTLPNAKAIGINLQGFAWSPQDPANLTGSVTVPDTGPGGACRPEGPRPPYYRELREKDFWPKYRKKKKYEELLEELQAKADVPDVVVEAVSVLAGKTEAPQIETRAEVNALAALVQAYRVNQRASEQAIAQANRQADADAEMIAVVLALEEEELKQIMAIAMLLASEP